MARWLDLGSVALSVSADDLHCHGNHRNQIHLDTAVQSSHPYNAYSYHTLNKSDILRLKKQPDTFLVQYT